MANVYQKFSNAGMGIDGHITPRYFTDFARDWLYSSLYFRQLGTKITIPRGFGDKVRIPRWKKPIAAVASASTGGAVSLSGQLGFNVSLSAITGSWTEGSIYANIKNMSAEDITGQTQQFLGGIGYTDKFILVTKGNFMENALESLTREMAAKLDVHTRKGITASAHLLVAGGGTKAGNANVMRGKECARIAPTLGSRNVPRWPDGTFVGVGHEILQYDLMTDISATGFISVARYGPERTKIYRGELGEMYGIRWLLTNAVPRLLGGLATSATTGLSGVSAVTGSNAYIFGPDAFYSLEIEGGGMEVIHHPPGSSGSVTDPANIVGSLTIKLHYGVTPAPAADWRLVRFAHGTTLHL